jgi:hypothetical protein
VCPRAVYARRSFLVSLSSPRSNPSSPDTFICSSIVQMHYQMQMHGRRLERPLIPKGRVPRESRICLACTASMDATVSAPCLSTRLGFHGA